MTKARKLIIIIPTAIVTIFLLVCITAGVFRWKHHSANWTQYMCEGCRPPSAPIGVCYESYDFVQDLYAAVRYYCWFSPSSDTWVKCRKFKYVQRYLRNEKVKEINFGMVPDEFGMAMGEHDVNSLETWEQGITEPEKIKRILQLISTAQEEINFPSVPPWEDRMIIITDKYKFVIPIETEIWGQTIHGLDWASKELYKQLWEWGYGYNYKYNLPPKEKVVAILLYPHRDNYVHPATISRHVKPLAFFGDEKLAKEIMFGIWIRKDRKEWKSTLIGFREEAKDFKPEKIFEGRDWLEKIMDAYNAALKEATERGRYYPTEFTPIGHIKFITQDGSHWKEIGIDANTVYDDYIKSHRLKKYFDELGLTKELLAGEPNRIPQN